MSLLKIFGLVCTMIVPLSAQEFYHAPYLIYKDTQEILLKLASPRAGRIQVQFGKNDLGFFSLKEKELITINLGPRDCHNEKEIVIKGNGHEWHEFVEKAPCDSEEPLRFAFISDTQENRTKHQDISTLLTKHHQANPYQFIINGGDIVDQGNDISQWHHYLEDGHQYMKNIPQVAVIGNHDYKGFKGKRPAPLPAYFKKYMRWKNIHPLGNIAMATSQAMFLIINSNFKILSPKQIKWQKDWMEEQIARAKSQGLPIIIATHFPVFSSSLNKFFSKNVKQLKKLILPLVNKHNIKVVLSGHTHMYERSIHKGVHYIVAGPAGGQKNRPTWKNKFKVFLNPKILTLSSITIQQGVFNLRTYDQKDNLVDQLKIQL